MKFAESQAGYFTSQQARDLGFSWERLSDNATTGRFNRIQHGIYRLSQFPGSKYEDMFIAWLNAGENSVISHESALALYELSNLIPSRNPF